MSQSKPPLFQARPSREPFRVEILLLDDFTLMGLAAIMEPLRVANRAARATLYEWSLSSVDGRPARSSSGVDISVETAFDARTQVDLVMVVASFHVEEKTSSVRTALRRLQRCRATVGAVDGATWALALSGLLDGRRATTHWEDLDAFAARFPAITVVPNRYVVDGTRVTTGGAAPALDLMLDMVTAQHGLALALQVANAFIYDPQPVRDTPQSSVPLGRLICDDVVLTQVLRLMEEHIADPLPVKTLAVLADVSPRTLDVRFRSRLGTSCAAHYRSMRLAAARRALVSGRTPIAEVADGHGFSSAAVFARAFRREYGESPSDVRRASSRARGL